MSRRSRLLNRRQGCAVPVLAAFLAGLLLAAFSRGAEPAAHYTYRNATVQRVIDGDTFIATIDLGFELSVTSRFRLAGVDAPELRKADPRGEEVRLYAAALLSRGIREIGVFERDKYGRWLARVTVTVDGKAVDLSEHLIARGMGVPYFGGKREGTKK